MGCILINVALIYNIAFFIGMVCAILFIFCFICEFNDNFKKYSLCKQLYNICNNDTIVFILTVVGIGWITGVIAQIVIKIIIPYFPCVVFI